MARPSGSRKALDIYARGDRARPGAPLPSTPAAPSGSTPVASYGTTPVNPYGTTPGQQATAPGQWDATPVPHARAPHRRSAANKVSTHKVSTEKVSTNRVSTPRRLGMIGVLTATVAAASLLTGPGAQAAPPTPVAASTARGYLSQLTVAAEGSASGYSRDKFPHWITQSGACDTREVVLKRDGTGVQQNSSCAATSGTWKSAYDGETWTASSDVDIDHIVPLAEAWRSGASGWTTAERQQLANDLTRPQLIAVTDNVNQSKSDKDPADWMPPLSSYACMYARMWVQVKHYYDLTVDTAEKSALQATLGGC